VELWAFLAARKRDRRTPAPDLDPDKTGGTGTEIGGRWGIGGGEES
jgi:hypothetical protein